jgi:protein involved in polysaccharide export with SLBB domain
MNIRWLSCFLALVFSQFASSIAADMEQYRLGAGDVINIAVFDEPNLSLKTKLPQLGVINYPFLGDITVVGLTASQLESTIYRGLLGDYLIKPSVSVTILEYRPFFIDGEVKRSGGYPYQPSLTIDKAAALAGGYTQRASKTKIIIRREVNGQQTNLNADPNDIVLPGDIVTIQQSFF